MATFSDVRKLALAHPDTDEVVSRGTRHWRVGEKLFVWERPLRKSDLAALGEAAPQGPILGVRTVDLDEKEAMLGARGGVFFTIPHFNGYPALLLMLEKVTVTELKPIVAEAHRARMEARPSGRAKSSAKKVAPRKAPRRTPPAKRPRG